MRVGVAVAVLVESAVKVAVAVGVTVGVGDAIGWLAEMAEVKIVSLVVRFPGRTRDIIPSRPAR